MLCTTVCLNVQHGCGRGSSRGCSTSHVAPVPKLLSRLFPCKLGFLGCLPLACKTSGLHAWQIETSCTVSRIAIPEGKHTIRTLWEVKRCQVRCIARHPTNPVLTDMDKNPHHHHQSLRPCCRGVTKYLLERLCVSTMIASIVQDHGMTCRVWDTCVCWARIVYFEDVFLVLGL